MSLDGIVNVMPDLIRHPWIAGQARNDCAVIPD